MKKTMKKILCSLLVVVMCLNAMPLQGFVGLAFKVEAVDYKVGDIIEFGSYPQTEVKDEATINALNLLAPTWDKWTSYGYYSGDGNVGSMKQGDWMRYTDVSYNGAKYRGVKFTEYRPFHTWKPTAKSNTYQSTNGYETNKIYWFKFESIKWRVLDAYAKLVVSELLLDSQAFNNSLYGNGDVYSEHYNDSSKTTKANVYEKSSIKAWLNGEFYNLAFNNKERTNILSYGTGSDKVTLLSVDEVANNKYGFNSNAGVYDDARRGIGSDYAKSQGLYLYESGIYEGNSFWILRTAGSYSVHCKEVTYSCSVTNVFGLNVATTNNGIRPALKLKDLSGTKSSKGETHYSNHTNLLNAHMVKVVDKNGNPIGDAIVTVDGKQYTTNPDGTVHFTTNAKKATIGVIKNGYLPINNDKLEHTLSQTGSTLFVMYEIGDNTPYNLQSAIYSDSLNEVNVLYGIKRISLKNESSWIDNGKFNLKCVANVPSAVYKYELWQNKTKIVASTDGEFTDLEIGDFEKGGDIKVRVYKDKKTFISNSINLKFEEDKKISGTSLSLGGSGLNLSFDDSIPYLGCSEVSIDFPDLPIEVYMETGENGKKEVHVGVNAKIYDAEKEMNGKWSKSQKESWKEQVNKNIEEITDAMDILKKYKGGLTKTEKNKINKAINNNDKSNIPGLDKCSISFIGYGKGEYIEGVKESVEIYLYVIADLQGYGMTQQFMVWIVPFVVDIESNLGLSSEVKGKWDILNDSFSADWKVNIKPSLEAFGGVGIGKVVNVGATGEAILDVEVQLLGTNTSTGVNSVDLEGSLGVSATFGIFEFKKNFMKDTWHLYTRQTKKMMYAKSPAANSQIEVYNLDNYSLHNLSYLENESEWISQPIQTYSRTRNTDNGTYNTVNILLSNTYKNMQPMIVTTKDNTVVGVFLSADISRNIYNAPIAMYSVYDSETNSWATPVPFDNNNTSDSVPYLHTDGNDIYAVYLDSSETITENDSIDDYAIKQNVTVAKFNKATGGFDSIEVVESAKGDFKSNPQIVVIDNIPTVVWQSNNNDPFGLCSENTLYKSEYIDGRWTEKQAIVDNQNGIVGLATDLSGIAYIIDGDNNFATTEDRTIYLSDNYKEFVMLESGVVSNPVFSENGKLFWYSNGTLKTYEDEIRDLYLDGIIGFTDKFDIINNKVYYIGSSDEGKNLFVLTYDENANAWTAPVQITNQTKDIDYFTVGNIGGQTIATMTLREYTITEDVFEDTCDLAYVILEEKHDVKVEYVDYEHDNVVPSSNLPLTVGVTNNGSTELEEFEITVSDTNENLICTTTYLTSLNPGESSEYIVEMPLGKEITLGNYKVSINETEYYDTDSSNNSKEITIGYCNFEVVAEPAIINDVRYAIINVTNKSYTKSSGSLNIYNVLNPDEPVDSVAIEELAYGESLIYQLPIDNEILGGDEGVITIKAISDVEQYNSYNCNDELYFDISTSTIPETYKVTWLIDAAEEVHTYEEGAVIKEPEEPSKDGFYFVGWEPSVPEMMPAEDITFTAQWLPINDPKVCELFGCKYTEIVTPATCISKGYTTYTCSVCGDTNIDDYVEAINHKQTSKIVTPATLTQNGKIATKCTVCGEVQASTTIYYPKTIKLSSSEVTYNSKTRSPSVIIKDSKGNTLKKGIDYDITTPSGRKLPGVYEYKITFKGNYEGEKVLNFTIVPKTVDAKTIKATQSTSVIKLTWGAVEGATGYRVYQYSPSKGKYVQIASVKGVNSYRKATNLKAGTEYKFKIKPYTKLSDGTVLFGTASAEFVTATECKAPKITSINSPSKSKATVKWSNVDGETGYQLYYSTSENGTYKKVNSYTTDKLIGSKSFSSSTSGKTIYFKVRAYKKVNGQTIFSEWSAVKSVKLK